MASDGDPFEGWEMWSAGCHWSRTLPDGRKVTLSTWQCGADGGYSLTMNYKSTNYPDLDAALSAYEQLALSAAR